MSTTMTATFPNLEFSADPASGTIHGAATMPISALAWSQADVEEPAFQSAIPAGPVVSARKPRFTRPVIVATLFGAVTVAAALGAIVLGGNDAPSTPLAVADHAESAPYAPPAPAPATPATRVVVPAAVSEVTVPAVTAPKPVAPTQTIAVPTVTETPKPAQHPDRPHWNWPHWNWRHQDQQDQTR
ncbi:hypothetical protein [Mycolicibacterium aubagnense]|uniref:Uncharacterized protein n=1 Tax=Mycolicibacterium aubagnense TaxID=319707 RepID=A0ABN5YR46_9MYCO|nr:hypothetical protein [Mycolicibacterium aubagnense]TLH56842.1 hypothetical protein C1S80_22495 [Mycolicibacterium aubagnense]WGI33947.1 hypothetical protein QDT91_06225 [Mycolicibacterium aubagnense]BBX84276.1 hypothetical protein MAUB_21490 [Mycolicibacterium aubagnense]